MKKQIRLTAAAVLLLGFSSHAQAASIDFGAGIGGPSTGHIILTNQLSSLGVTFSTTNVGGVHWWGGDYSWSPGRYSITAGGLGSPQFIDPIQVDFSTTVNQASIRGFDGGGDIDTLILNAYDSLDNLLDTDSITNSFAAPGWIASVFSTTDISYITFEVSVSSGAGLLFDDLNFSAVPVPGAVWLFGSGLLGLIGFSKRKRAA